MDKVSRLLWADSLKGLLMILVILGHAIQGYMPEACFHNHVWNLIYSFHMPAFMAVSGYFAYRVHRVWGGKLSTCKRRFLQLLVPYFAWSIVSMIVSGEVTFLKLENIFLHPDTSFWFLWVLFWINILFVLGQWIAEKCHLDELIPISTICVVLLGMMVGLEFRLFGFQFLAYYFLFYTLGYVVHRFSFLQVSKNGVLVLLLFAWFCLAWSWEMHELPNWMPMIPHVPASLLHYAYRGGTAMLAVFFLLGVAPKVLNSDKGIVTRNIREIGVVSLGYYTCHLTLMGYVVDGLKALMNHVNDGIIITSIFVISLVITYIVVEFLKKNIYTARVLLGKI